MKEKYSIRKTMRNLSLTGLAALTLSGCATLPRGADYPYQRNPKNDSYTETIVETAVGLGTKYLMYKSIKETNKPEEPVAKPKPPVDPF